MSKATELEDIHKRIGTAMGQFSLMLSRRRFSPRALLGISGELQIGAKELKDFAERNLKP